LLHTPCFDAAIETLKVPGINKFMAALRMESLSMWLVLLARLGGAKMNGKRTRKPISSEAEDLAEDDAARREAEMIVRDLSRRTKPAEIARHCNQRSGVVCG
jgi:hypothetical protein